MMRPSWLALGLGVSLALNVFLIGAGATALVLNREAPRSSQPRTLVAAAEELKPENRAAFRAMLHEQGRRIRPEFRRARQDRREAAALFAAEAYDRQAVSALLSRARTRESAARAELEEAVLDFAQGLDREERAAMAVTLRRGMKVDHKKGRHQRRGRGEARRQP